MNMCMYVYIFLYKQSLHWYHMSGTAHRCSKVELAGELKVKLKSNQLTSQSGKTQAGLPFCKYIEKQDED